MKKILSLFVIVFFFSFQQNKNIAGVFEYEQFITRNKGYKFVATHDLLINDNFSTYTQKFTDKKEKNYTENNNEGVSKVTITKQKKTEMAIVYNDFITKEMYFKESIAFKIFYIKEDQFEMIWNIHNDFKFFGDRKCKKATTTFRGREYTAWFSSEIKLNIGPWKFNNTPGLIFEVYDNEKVLHILLKNINTKVRSNINSWKEENIKKTITLKQYIIEKEKEEDIVLAQFNSKLPKNSPPFIKNTEQKSIEIFQK